MAPTLKLLLDPIVSTQLARMLVLGAIILDQVRLECRGGLPIPFLNIEATLAPIYTVS